MSLAKRNSPPRPQDARDLRDALVLHEAALPMPPLRPRIGIDQIEARERCRRQPGQHVGRVAVMQPDVGKLALVDRSQRLGHAVDERLDADEAGARMALGLRDQMLAAAEPAFQAHLVDAVEQRAQVGWRGALQIERELRQQRVEQRRLPRPQRHGPCAGRRRRRLRRRCRRLVHAMACHRTRKRTMPGHQQELDAPLSRGMTSRERLT